jgi:uncharacterized protein YhfF
MLAIKKRFKFGWFGDGGLGERLIDKILSGRKTATCCPAYDPEDADLCVGDLLELTDKHGRPRATLEVVKVELRPFGSFDEALAASEGTTLSELVENARFANGRVLRADEEMRVVYFRVAQPRPS